MSAKFFLVIFMSSERSSTFLISPKLVSTHLGSSARQKACETQMHLHRTVITKYFVLHSLHKILPSTTLYWQACTKHFPVLLCTTKLAQSTSQYYFVLQSLHKVRPSTTLYYKACTKYVPALLCTTKLAQITFQYYFVLQSLHKILPSTTLYHKAFTHRTLTHSAYTHGKRLHTHTASFYAETRLHTEKLLHIASFYAQNLLHTAIFHRQKKGFYTEKLSCT